MIKKELIKKVIPILLMFVMFASITSAIEGNGLVVTPTNINIDDKIYNEDTTYEINVSNHEIFKFKDISFENEKVHVNSFNLSSSESKLVNITLKNIDDLNETIPLKGYYYSEQLGESGREHNITIIENDQLSKDSFTIYESEVLNFINGKSEKVYLIFGDENPTGIEPGEKRTITINNKGEKDYYFSDDDEMTQYSKLTDINTITILDKEDWVTNPEYNPEIHFDINTIYPPTNISVTLMENNFTINPFESTDVILSIKNEGEEHVKNLQLNGKWMNFRDNNFDITPSNSKATISTIIPQLTSTNQTNKTYNYELEITGNFETVTKDYSIFVPYTEIEEGEYTQGKSLEDWVIGFCESNPNHEICGGKTRIIYKNTTENMSIQTGTEQFNEFVSYLVKNNKDMKEKLTQNSELIAKLQEEDTNETVTLDQISNRLNSLTESSEDKNDITVAVIVFTIILVITLLLLIIIRFLRKQNKIPSFLEKSWRKINKAE